MEARDDEEDFKIFKTVVNTIVKRKKREFKTEHDEILEQRQRLANDKKRIRADTLELQRLRNEHLAANTQEQIALEEVKKVIENERKAMRIESVQMDEIRAADLKKQTDDWMQIDNMKNLLAEERRVFAQEKDAFKTERDAIDLEKAGIELEWIVLEESRKKGRSIYRRMMKELRGYFYDDSDVDDSWEMDTLSEVNVV